MAKKGSYQRKQERKNRITAVLGILFLTFVLFISGAEFIRHWIVIATWDTGGILEYQGEYTLKVQERMSGHSSRYHYTFIMDNGDKLTVGSRYLQNADRLLLAQDTGDKEELIVRYTRFPELLQGKNDKRAVSIVSAANGTVYYAQDKADFRGEMVLFAVVGLLMLVFLIPVIWLFFDGPAKRLWTRMRQKRRREKRKQEQKKTDQSPQKETDRSAEPTQDD